jgi:hypothetical protein
MAMELPPLARSVRVEIPTLLVPWPAGATPKEEVAWRAAVKAVLVVRCRAGVWWSSPGREAAVLAALHPLPEASHLKGAALVRIKMGE